ncbi:MAG: type 1 glutamine amidotransferase [Gammaproteobacteria bacterium]|nr:type 1 glutamine amidotransferase [Gammaproteobacteria bacterium]
MKPIAIFRHLECEGPGYFADFLDQQRIPHILIRIDQGDPVPGSAGEFSALVFMGGPMSVNDDLPWIAEELSLIQRAVERELPMLGHCLGGQLIAKALGGIVSRNPVKEIGWHTVNKQHNPLAQDWLTALPDEFEAFHWHGETFSIPRGATPLLSSQYCQNQAFAIGNTLALQFHVEMTEPMVREWVAEYANEISMPSESIQPGELILENLDSKIDQLNSAAHKIYHRWIRALQRRD